MPKKTSMDMEGSEGTSLVCDPRVGLHGSSRYDLIYNSCHCLCLQILMNVSKGTYA